MNYFDTATAQVQTTAMLTQRGIPVEPAFLHAHGIRPIKYTYPDFNADLYEMLPDGEPHPDETSAGGDYVQDFMVVPLQMERARRNLRAKFAARRYEAEMGGMDFAEPDGSGAAVRLPTDVESRTRLQTALDAVASSEKIAVASSEKVAVASSEKVTVASSETSACPPDVTIQFKLDGEFRTMTRAELLALRDAIAAHVQACFDRERELWALIDAAPDVPALENVPWKDGWPGGGR